MTGHASPTLLRELIAEALGTALLVFFGVGAVHVAVLADGFAGLWQVAAVWGVGVALAIYATAAISGAHLNPAVTLALAVWRGFDWRRVGPFVVAQLVGAITAATVLHGLFHRLIARFEHAHDLVRGAAGSERSAMIYGEYFPNPGMFDDVDAVAEAVTLPLAAGAEAIGTGLLVFFIFALTDQFNDNRPGRGSVAVLIGAVVTGIICVIAPLTQAGLNPARDFGPRVVAWCAGWGEIAIPGPRGGFFTVYILAPVIGGVIGGGLYDVLLRRAMQRGHARPETPAERDDGK